MTSGTANSGKLYFYNGTVWKTCQEKIKINQSPLFDMYDNSDIQYNDIINYQ